MKYLKVYENYKTLEEVQKICKKYEIINWTLRDDGKVDVDDNVNIKNKKLISLPLSFGHVSGNFDCSFNQLTTLEGAPQSVGGSFYCSFNQLTTLEGGPQSVEGNFNCAHNKLTTLEGSPESVDGDFSCHYNKLTTLQGAPKSVDGNFWCHNNKLTTLEGAPISVDGNFNCFNNRLTTLEGAPKSVENFRYDKHNLTKYLKDFLKLNAKQEVIKSILKWQDDYKMYNSRGKFNKQRFIQMMEDIVELDGIQIKFPD